ncbi:MULTISPECIES: cytochrome P450 [Streptomyces]|uniref:Cytochrome P450 n=1 Tax=Streptomyces lonegramiae TaxID=3075524 RepID=A0ABU2X8Q1_9ACTN|nr:cytochrome P450 [Streptomyces sp. DSM 41529]MDT0542296.1 cytochrome P450 [Streptomyces sp. DSM 41529]
MTVGAPPGPPDPVPLYGPGLDGDMPARYERMRREHGPVVPVAIAPGVEAWLVLGHRELLHLTRDEQYFSHDPRRWSALRDGRVPPDSPLIPLVGWRPALLFADGRQHRRMRQAVAEALARLDGHELIRRVRATAERLIAGFADRHEADLVPQYARMLPLQVVTQLLGLDEEQGPRLVEAIAAVVAPTAAATGANRRMGGMLLELIERKKRQPGPDVTSWLLEHEVGLSDQEVLHNLVVIIVAGNQTTVNWIADAVRVLLTDPGFRSSLSGGHLTVDDALDLVLWRYPPTANFPGRYATRDLRFGGQHIRAGDMLILGLAGANADPEVLPEDGRPVVGNRSHLAFGAGPHTCPAQDPARLITRTAVDTLRHRLPDLELAVTKDQLTWITSPWSKNLAGLPVRFTAPQLAAGAATTPTADPDSGD